ncbi:MAG: maleylacetoacetate isomerase [Gammaproteobacteria bacterium]
MAALDLYTYFRSSCAYRVRIALNLKSIAYEPKLVHLLRRGGEQQDADYLRLNPQGLIPTLVDGDIVLTQSLAIIEYLEEKYPSPPLLPARPEHRAYVRALAQIIACDIQPINNLRVLNYLRERMGHDEEAVRNWCRHWISIGFEVFESWLQKHQQPSLFCFGDTPTLADICLIPQIYNARRVGCDPSGFPMLMRIATHCLDLEPFQRAAPEQQPDSVGTE